MKNQNIIFIGLAFIGIFSSLIFFKLSEFADKISGKNEMKLGTIIRLNIARFIAGIPFTINSGYRDENHPETLLRPTSSHARGHAVDIHTTPETARTIEHALRKAGFTRIGIASTYIHADDDPDKTQEVTWFYDGKPTIYNIVKPYYV